MAGINPQAIRELRERTQAGMSDCKAALEEAGGDMEKAVEIILKKGQAKTAKKAGMAATEGMVRASVAADRRSATMVEVNIQTDFAARNDAFREFVAEVLAAAEKAPDGADLGAQPLRGKTVAEAATELAAKIGEKIAVRRWTRLAVPEGQHGLAHAYVHLGDKIGVVLAIETGTAEAASHPNVTTFADELALQIAAMNPAVLRREDVSADTIAKQKEIFEAQLREDPKPKPEAAWPKIIEGKLQKFYTDVVLLEQDSIRTPGSSIDQLRQAAEKAAGASVTITGFVRYECGEGVEKAPKGDFAEEAMRMASS